MGNLIAKTKRDDNKRENLAAILTPDKDKKYSSEDSSEDSRVHPRVYLRYFIFTLVITKPKKIEILIETVGQTKYLYEAILKAPRLAALSKKEVIIWDSKLRVAYDVFGAKCSDQGKYAKLTYEAGY